MTLQFNGIAYPIIGSGSSAVVIAKDKTAVKLPKSYLSGCNDDEDGVIQREKDIYLRLGKCDGVVPYLDLSGPGIVMVWMENGSLRDYLNKHQVTRSLQLSWFREMSQCLAIIHGHHVIVADINIRNFLVANDMSVKFSDFTESTLVELDLDMQTADDNGYSIYTDIGQIGAVMYEVITGQKCDFDLFKDQPQGPAKAMWPRRDSLPSTQDVWLGLIIEKCWTKGAFRSSDELAAALVLATL